MASNRPTKMLQTRRLERFLERLPATFVVRGSGKVETYNLIENRICSVGKVTGTYWCKLDLTSQIKLAF
jgi:hypothetical protein